MARIIYYDEESFKKIYEEPFNINTRIPNTGESVLFYDGRKQRYFDVVNIVTELADGVDVTETKYAVHLKTHVYYE